MAGEWIPMRCDLAGDPAVVSIARATKLDPDAVVGKLHRLWAWAGSQSADGYLPGIDLKWIDELVRKKGFAMAMTVTPITPWLEIDPAGVRIPNFQRWLGSSSKSRMANTLRQSKARQQRDTGATVVAQESDQCSENVTEKARPQERTLHKNPPPPTPAAVPPDPELEPEWSEVEGVLFGLDVRRSRDAVLSARSHGCEPGAVKNLAEFYRARRPEWNAGALFDRVVAFRPGQDFTALWPENSQESERARASEISAAKNSKQAKTRANGAKAMADKEFELERLERQFGSVLDAMDRREVRSIIEDRFAPLLSKFPKAGPVTAGLLRQSLLVELESMATTAP